jgi:AraC-like DNA-binding protein
MVCNRCITAVKNLLNELNIEFTSVQLGEVEVSKAELSEMEVTAIREGLNALGFELLNDSKKRLIEKMKTLIIQHIHYQEDDEKYNLSHILSTRLHKDYSYLSHLFSEVEGITIEKYTINQKIEKVKELLVYDEKSLSEIAFELGYSSVAHLSAQFKKVTGLTPSHFKKLGYLHRKTIDNV